MKRSLFFILAFLIFTVCKKSPTDIDQIKSIEITPDNLKIATGDTSTLTVTIRDALGNIIEGKKVAWIVQDTSILVLLDGGKIKAKKEGPTVVRAMCEGSYDEAVVSVFDFLGQALLENQTNHEAIKISWRPPGEKYEKGYIPTDSLGYFVLPHFTAVRTFNILK